MSELYHYGVPRMKHGIRNYQNPDGTWTELGKARRRKGSNNFKFVDRASKLLDPVIKAGEEYASSRDPKTLETVKKRGNLTTQEATKCINIANVKYFDLKQTEPYVTESVSKSIGSTSKLHGLEHRLKTPISIAAKIGADAKADNVSFKEAASSMGDGIRYTVMTPTEDFVQAYKTFNENMSKQGFIEMKCKNNFVGYAEGKVMHKSVQSQYSHTEDPSLKFEIQFQTPESQNAKDLKIPIYEERRKAGNTEERNRELEQQMRDLADAVKDPSGVSEIKSFNRYKMTHSSLEGGSMYVKDPSNSTAIIHSGTLILGDNSSYLEHYGRPGQKWGVRNYQNPDGSLTPLGYIHYGYGKARKAAGEVAKATAKGLTGTAKTAHKIGEHVSASMTKAKKKYKGKVLAKRRKAALKKKEKLAKKKEKLSQTREEVIKNKDLFTTDELKALNDRFDTEDRLKMKESLESQYDYDSKRLAKKKEKAAQTREGVLKNKELFTTDELRALSQRFDVEDDISMGKVRKGAEIVGKVAENVEKVAKAVKAGGDAYNVLTGKAPLKDKKKDKNKDKDNSDNDSTSDSNNDGDNKKKGKGGNQDSNKNSNARTSDPDATINLSNMVSEAESRRIFSDLSSTMDFSNAVSEEESRRIFSDLGETADISNVVREAGNRANTNRGSQLSDADVRYIQQGLEEELRRIMAT